MRNPYARPDSLAFFTGYADYYDLLEVRRRVINLSCLSYFIFVTHVTLCHSLQNLDEMLDVLGSDEGKEAHNLAQGTMTVQDGSDDDERTDHHQVGKAADDGMDEIERWTAEANVDVDVDVGDKPAASALETKTEVETAADAINR